MSNKTQDEVEKFLQDLDVLSIKKPTKPTNATQAGQIPVVRNTEPFQSSAQTVQSSASPMVAPEVKPAVVQPTTPSVSTPSKVTTQTASPIAAKSPVVPIIQPVVAPPTLDTTSMGPPPPVSQAGVNKQKIKKATHGFVPLAAAVDVEALKAQETAQNDSMNFKRQEYESWNFSSLWNKASEVTKVVAGNENVLKMANTVNSNLNKLAETIAPKIAIQHQIGLLADKITIWLCVEAEQDISRDVLKDFTYSTANDLWLNPGNRICKYLRVNNVNHSDSFGSKNLQEAIQKTEGMVKGLQKLSDEQQLTPGVDSSHVVASVIMIVQQICLPLSCTLLDDPVHTFFLVTLICDTPELGFISCSSCSQSIVKPVGFLKSDSAWGQWESSQRVRVLETVIGDIIEEFIAKVGHIRQFNNTN